MIIDYLLCQYAKVNYGKIVYSNTFTITVAVKITLLQTITIASAH